MYHPVHGTARLTKSTYYCCQLIALPLIINRQLQRINLENTNIGYIWRTSPIRTDTKLACVAALRIARMQEPTGGRLAYPLCQLFNTLVKFIKYYHIISVNPVQNIWVGKVAIQNYNGTIQGHIIHLCLN